MVNDKQVTELIPGKLVALTNPYPVDGRVSWHPPDARGVACMNSYLLTEGNRTLFVDTGLGIHRAAILAQLSELVPAKGPLEVFTLRHGEFDSVGNLAAICEAFDVTAVLGMYDDNNGGEMWGDYKLGRHVKSIQVGRDERIELGATGERTLYAFFPALRLLNTHWLYDEATRTLFTSDSFTYVMRNSDAGPWVLTEDDDSTVAESVRRHLLETRFWWLAGARLATVRDGLASVFRRWDVETIAPAYGCVLSGRAVVERHVRMIDEVLADLDAGDDDAQATFGGRLGVSGS